MFNEVITVEWRSPQREHELLRVKLVPPKDPKRRKTAQIDKIKLKSCLNSGSRGLQGIKCFSQQARNRQGAEERTAVIGSVSFSFLPPSLQAHFFFSVKRYVTKKECDKSSPTVWS